VAIVLGCGPGRLLDWRMDAACSLAELGRVDALLLSGLHNEMPTMVWRARAVLPEDRVWIDDGAVRTVASLVRARERFGVTRALLVSQAYHLPRALALAAAVGIDAQGVVAHGLPSRTQRVRERVARVRARLDQVVLALGGRPRV
jgi:SanA protein